MTKQTNTRWNSKVGIHGERPFDFERAWYRFAFELIEKHVPPSSRMIELCCGAGEFSQILVSRNFQMVSVDGDERNISRLNETGCEAYCADLEKPLNFDNCSFDAAVILEGIEHIVNCENMLKEINRIVRPEGYLILSTPNFSWLQDRIKYLLGCNANNEGVHLRFFTVDSLNKMLKSSGFKVIDKNSFTPFVGYNRIMRVLFHKKPLFLRSVSAESIFAQDLVWLCRKNDAEVRL